MATSRTAKVQAEIEKAKAKLAEQQSKLKELEGKRTELENMEIVDIVRGMSIPLDDLATLLQSMKGGAPASGQLGPKSEKPTSEEESETEQEDEAE